MFRSMWVNFFQFRIRRFFGMWNSNLFIYEYVLYLLSSIICATFGTNLNCWNFCVFPWISLLVKNVDTLVAFLLKQVYLSKLLGATVYEKNALKVNFAYQFPIKNNITYLNTYKKNRYNEMNQKTFYVIKSSVGRA